MGQEMVEAEGEGEIVGWGEGDHTGGSRGEGEGGVGVPSRLGNFSC